MESIKYMHTNAPRCPTLYAFNQHGKLVAVRCGSWYCPHCAEKNAKQWAWRVRLHVNQDKRQAWFWTLTLMPSITDPKTGFEILAKRWDRLRQWMKRHMTEKWCYCAFVEGQPQRAYMPHFHIISMQKCPKRLKDVAVWCGYGYEAKEKKVTSDKAAWYVAKYASKQSPITPKNFRRVRSSQDWAKLPPYEGRSLYVRAGKESLQMYLERVSEGTGVALDDLVHTWLRHKTVADVYPEDETDLDMDDAKVVH